MNGSVDIYLRDIANHRDIWESSFNSIVSHLQRSGKNGINSSSRYSVHIKIDQGKRPNYDIDNYAKQIIDTLTNTRLLWGDDSQVDELFVKRTIDPNVSRPTIKVTVRQV
jgi:Holliday junction resolvase RusA-like endonuclease